MAIKIVGKVKFSQEIYQSKINVSNQKRKIKKL